MYGNLEQTKPGDQVIVWGSWNGPYVAKVGRVTKTQIIIAHPRQNDTDYLIRYNRATGRQVGERWGNYIETATEESLERMADVQKQRANELLMGELKNKIRNRSFRGIDLDTLKAIWKLIEPKEKED